MMNLFLTNAKLHINLKQIDNEDIYFFFDALFELSF